MVKWLEYHMAAIGHSILTLVSWIMVKLEIRWGPLVERGDRCLGRSGSGMWKAGAFKAVAPTCVG
jgi:hypothetical protein